MELLREGQQQLRKERLLAISYQEEAFMGEMGNSEKWFCSRKRHS